MTQLVCLQVKRRKRPKIVKSKEESRRAFWELGQSWTVSEDLFILLERFTCSMYMSVGNTTGCVNVTLLTGCDIVSVFGGKEMKGALRS